MAQMWLIRIGAVAAALVALYFSKAAYDKNIYDEGYAAANVEWQAKYDASIIENNAKIREIESNWQTELEKVKTDGDTKIKNLQNEYAATSAANDSMLDAAHKHAQRFAACSATASSGATAIATVNMLPVLLGRCGERVTELAKYADELVIDRDYYKAAYGVIAKGEM